MDDIKELFAHFGAAYYLSEVLHKSLCHIYILLTFNDPNDITRPRVDEKAAQAYAFTLGQIVEKTKDLLPTEFENRLNAALEKRNYLAHNFWFERCHLMFSEQGLLELKDELLELQDFFKALDEDIDEYVKPLRETYGVTNAIVMQCLEEIMEGNLIELTSTAQRLPKKQERIVKAWDVRISENGIAQIFESEDGCLWQFCDVGLGWTSFKKPALDWKINEMIQNYLPVAINPRPTISEPWNYELKLAKGAVLWVKRGKKEKSYAWGVKKNEIWKKS